jgi:hypothetical protein
MNTATDYAARGVDYMLNGAEPHADVSY